MRVVDWAPFPVAFVAGGAAGALLAGRLPWLVAVLLPVAHLVLGVAAGRVREGFVDYVVPVNLVLLAIARGGVLPGRWQRRHQLSP